MDDIQHRIELLIELLDTNQTNYQSLRGPAMNILLGILEDLKNG